MIPKEITAHATAYGDKENVVKYINKFTSIETLVFDWLGADQNNSFELGNGIDDDEQFSLVGLCLKRQQDERTETVAELYYDLAEVKSEFCKYPLFESYVTIKENCKDFKSPFIVDDEAIDKFNDSIGFYFHEDFLNYASDTKLMIPYLMTFALSNGCGTMLSRTSKSFLEEIETDDDKIIELNHKSIYFCNSYLSHKNHSTCYDYYFIKEVCPLPLSFLR